MYSSLFEYKEYKRGQFYLCQLIWISQQNSKKEIYGLRIWECKDEPLILKATLNISNLYTYIEG
jgi:hypothetical protein